MKNKLTSLILLLCFPVVFLAQSKAKPQTLQQIKAEMETYFAKQLQQYGREYMEQEGSEYHEYKRWLRLWETRIGPNGTIEEYVKNISGSNSPLFTAKNTGPLSSMSVTDPWTELGPMDRPATGLDPVTDPSGWGCGGGDRGIGPIQYITFYKPNPNIMLASSLAGGLFYSSDKGVTWTNAGSDKWTISGCTSAAFSPTSSSTWYGCSNLGGNNNRHGVEANFAMGPGGIWRTTDGGVTNTLIADQYDFSLYGSLTTLHKILIDPNNAAVGYAATTGGLYKTVNITASNPTWFTIQTGNIEDIEFKSDNSGVLLITRQQTFSGGTTWNQSNDWVLETSTTWGGTTTSGGSWAVITAPTGGFVANQSFPSTSHHEPGNIELTTTEADPNLIYVEDMQYIGLSTKIYTYNYGTGAWSPKRTLYDVGFGIGRALGVSNINANTVYIGHNYSVYGAIYKSTDGGVTDAPLSTFSASTKYHVDIEYFGIPPYCVSCANGTDVYVGTHGGVSFSPDACVNLSVRSTGLGVAEVSGFAQTDQEPGKIVMGLDHDGSVMSETSGTYPSLSWETVMGGDGMPSFLDKSIVTNVATAYNWSGYYQLSITGGHVNTYTASTVLTNDYGVIQNIVTPNFLYHRKTPSGTPAFSQVFRSNDHGIANSEQISNFGSPYTSTAIQEIAVSPSNPNYMYIDIVINGTSHIIARNTNINALASTVQSSWVVLASPSSSGMGPAAVDYLNPDIIYITQYGSRVFKCDYTNPSSPVFTDISSNLPWIDFPKDLVLERGSNSGLYIGTGTGVWYTNKEKLTTSPSAAWDKLSALPNAPVTGLDINYTTNKLRAGTSGRGIWEHDLICPILGTLPLTGSLAPNFYEANYITAANATLQNGGTKIFRATNAVTLNAGFVAQASGTNNYFLAFIHGCSSGGNTLKLSNGNTQQAIFDEGENDREKEEEEKEFSVYPNPNSGVFSISFPSDEEKSIYIYDAMGELVYVKKETKEKNLNVDIGTLPKGMFIVKVVDGDLIQVQRVINQ